MQIEGRNLLGGGLILAIGAGAAIIGAGAYRIGTLAAPGPGLFPVALGVILAVLGAAIVFQGIGKAEKPIVFDGRSTIAILSAVIAFALSIRTLGLLPAVTLTVLIARVSEHKRYDPGGTLMLAAGAALAIWVIFVRLLDTPVPAFRWPF